MTPVGLDDIKAAAEAIASAVVRTPFLASKTLSELTGARVFVKFENLQYTASFKERGALNKLLALRAAGPVAGVIAVSAGNHAQGVAYHARRLGIAATIVMPRGTPMIKVRHTRAFGARVVLEGDDIDAAKVATDRIAAAERLTLVHPFDDPLIIAGQGTVALEMLAEQPDLDVIVVPIGGGGLISGIATAAKALRPDIRIVGVEAALYPAMIDTLAGRPVVKGGLTLADGIAVKKVGRLTATIVRRLVDDIVTVDERAIETAVNHYLDIEKTVAEGAGAASLAALESYRDRFADRRVGVVLSGGNIDSRLLASVIMRGLVRDQRIVRLRVALRDTPGALGELASVFGRAEANIIEVLHQRTFSNLSAKATDVEVVAETRDAEHVSQLIKALESAGFAAVRLDSRA
jgi:threonine dehydratase